MPVIHRALFQYDKHVYGVTGWLKASQKPVHVGVYQRDYSDVPGDGEKLLYCHWDGFLWQMPFNSIEMASMGRNTDSCYQGLPWRGLTKPVQP